MNEIDVVIDILAADEASNTNLVQDLTRLINTVYAESETGIWLRGADRTTSSEVAEFIALGEIAVARVGQKVVGSVRLQRLDRATGEFGMLVAAADVRSAGIGRRLVAFAEQWAFDNGFAELQLEVLSPRDWDHSAKEFLRGWYTRIGFESVRVDSFSKAFPAQAERLATPCIFTIYRKRLPR